MKKLIVILIIISFLSGCTSDSKESQNKSLFNEEELKQLEQSGIDIDQCKYQVSLKKMLKDDFKKAYSDQYCNLPKVSNAIVVNALFDKKVALSDIKEYAKLTNVQIKKIDRYLAYKDQKLSKKEIVLNVNLNKDIKPYEVVETIEDTKDVSMLINKYHKLPDGYHPENLVPTPSACTNEYSCFPSDQYIVKEAGDAFQELINLAKDEGITITAIASLRDYAYQTSLYQHYLNANGLEYADRYFARPGQSEHNSGLAIDITLDGMDYTTIETHPKYNWLIDQISDYGFVLRYPKDKEEVTGFSHESWHLRYVGKTCAKVLEMNNWTLEEYHARKAM
ncbi:MAG: M15 family metallopeptidase [Erysipelotrichaceae bacterium]